jgi:seryl-tRNA synthetase
MSTRDAYVAKMQTRLDERNAKLSALEAKAKDADEDPRGTYKETMAKLSAQSTRASTKLAEIKAAGEEKSETLVAEMDEIHDAFTHSFHAFKAQF